MKPTNVLLMLVIASVVMMPVFAENVLISAQANALCSDSDGGLNSYVKGTAKGINGEKTDSCLGVKTLMEWYCKRDSIVSSLQACPKGCVDGACIGLASMVVTSTTLRTMTMNGTLLTTTTTLKTSSKCSDSDGGLNSYVKGTAKGINGEKTDSCLGVKKLMEWYCRKDTVVYTLYACSLGCIDGACKSNETTTTTTTSTSTTTTTMITTTTTLRTKVEVENNTVTPDTSAQGNSSKGCVESDGGKNYYARGWASGGNGRKEDKCIDGTRVSETYCDGRLVRTEIYKCEKGCSRGACNKLA